MIQLLLFPSLVLLHVFITINNLPQITFIFTLIWEMNSGREFKVSNYFLMYILDLNQTFWPVSMFLFLSWVCQSASAFSSSPSSCRLLTCILLEILLPPWFLPPLQCWTGNGLVAIPSASLKPSICTLFEDTFQVYSW